MAVEARHTNLLRSHQFITNRDLMKQNQENRNICNTQMDYSVLRFSGLMSQTDRNLLPCYQPSPVYDLNPSTRTSMNKSDSGLTYNNIRTAPRKRSRDDSINDYLNSSHQKNKFPGSLLDQHIISQIQQHQSEINSVIGLHTERVRLELEERRKWVSRRLASAVEEKITKKLKEKDEEIQRIGNLNLVLNERWLRLCVENQMLRDLARTNEVTANSLRTNLEQLLVHHDRNDGCAASEIVAEDAVSSCGSCSDDGGNGNNKCKKCWERESGVLLFPCRHLCVCTVCGSSIHDCPVCNSVINGSVHVNFS